MPISCCRDCCTSVCQTLTSLCHPLEYGCAGAGVLSEGGLGSTGDAVWQAGEVAAQPCSSAAQVKQQATKVLLGLRIALLGGTEGVESICESFLKSGHIGHGLAGAGQLGACLLVLELLNLQAIPLRLHPPGTASGHASSSNGRHHVRCQGHFQHLHQYQTIQIM